MGVQRKISRLINLVYHLTSATFRSVVVCQYHPRFLHPHLISVKVLVNMCLTVKMNVLALPVGRHGVRTHVERLVDTGIGVIAAFVVEKTRLQPMLRVNVEKLEHGMTRFVCRVSRYKNLKVSSSYPIGSSHLPSFPNT